MTRPSETAPEELILEFARADDAGAPFAFRFSAQDYLLRGEDGAVESATFPWGAEMLSDLARLQQARPDRAVVQRLGDRLREFLNNVGWEAYEERITSALAAKRAVHITVRSSAAELYAVPWELVTLKSSGQHLGELPDCLLRYEWPGTQTAEPAPDPPPEGGRIVFAWSAAGGAVPASAHIEALRAACREGHHRFDEERDVVPHASLHRLREALAGGAPPAVLHILCHGEATASEGAGYGLVWNASRPGDGHDVIDAGTLRTVLAPYAGALRLVVLCACHGGAGGGPGNHLGSLVVADESDVGVAHEALIREWTTLRGWIGESREALLVLQALSRDARRWDAGGRSTDDLWRGGRLRRALELRDAGALTLSPLEASYLLESDTFAQRERKAAEAARQRAYDEDIRVGARPRLHLLIFFCLSWAATIFLVQRLVQQLTNALIMGLLVAILFLVALPVLLFRRRFSANRFGAQLLALATLPVPLWLVSHSIAHLLGVPVTTALAFDMLALGALQLGGAIRSGASYVTNVSYMAAGIAVATAMLVAVVPDHGLNVVAGIFALCAALLPVLLRAGRQSSVTSVRSPRPR